VLREVVPCLDESQSCVERSCAMSLSHVLREVVPCLDESQSCVERSCAMLR
jgi:hypothetical protein